MKNTLKSSNVQYRGVNTQLKNKDGYKFELQFHTEQSLLVKEENHKLYEQYRVLDNQDVRRKQELAARMVKNSNKVPMPTGIEEAAL